MILKGRKFYYPGEQHVNFSKGKELNQKNVVVTDGNGVDELYREGVDIYKRKYSTDERIIKGNVDEVSNLF